MQVVQSIIVVLLVIFLIEICEVEPKNATVELGCRDEEGNLVDWYYLYKLPRKYSDTKSSGSEYLYLTPTSNSSWTLSKNLVNYTTSMPGRTLAPAYDESINSDLLIIMYNDAPPNTADDYEYDYDKGHTKGVVVGNDKGGFWLVHSVPKYPPAVDEGSYDYPKSGTVYGQSYLCISMDSSQLKFVGKQLIYNEPNFYSSQVPDKLKRLYSNFAEALKMKKVTKRPYSNRVTLYSREGTKFKSFAKSSKFNSDLYEDLVAPYYKAGDFYVETWRHGNGNIDSDCSKSTKVYNVRDISIKSEEKITFPTMSDHSKWMVSQENDLICVGDINRQEHQKVRGGGTVCTKSEELSKVYYNAVADAEPCDLRNDRSGIMKNKINRRERDKFGRNLVQNYDERNYYD